MEREKRLERIINDRVLGGVCSGLGRYLNIDRTIIRLVFCIAFFLYGTGGLIYIILWIAMPACCETKTDNDNATQNSESLPQTTGNRNGNMAAGIILIALGILFLVCNFIPELNILKLWPVAIIALGITMIVNALKKKEQ